MGFPEVLNRCWQFSSKCLALDFRINRVLLCVQALSFQQSNVTGCVHEFIGQIGSV